jgi:hypothetical protein
LKTKKIHEEKMPRKEELFLSKTQIQKLGKFYSKEWYESPVAKYRRVIESLSAADIASRIHVSCL